MKFSKISNTSLDESYINKSVTLYGWVATKRKFGKISFVDLRDHSGIIQLVFSEDIKLSKESVIKVIGVVSKRKDINPSLKTGTIEVLVSEYELLSSSKELPFEISEKNFSFRRSKNGIPFLRSKKRVNAKCHIA